MADTPSSDIGIQLKMEKKKKSMASASLITGYATSSRNNTCREEILAKNTDDCNNLDQTTSNHTDNEWVQSRKALLIVFVS